MLKKADIILAIIIIVLGISTSYVVGTFNAQGSKILITVDGKEFGTYSLSENKTISVKQNNHTNDITIKEGSVSMFFSDCLNQVCVHTGSVSQTTQSIICLPNKVMVQIIGKGEPEYDQISN